VTGPLDLPTEHQDRSALLFAFGLAEIAFGLLALFLTILLVVRLCTGILARGEPDPAMLAPAILGHLLLGVYYVSAGVGSIRPRRWARPVVLAVSWLWLLTGTSALALAAVFLPGMMLRARPPGVDADLLSVAQGCGFAVLAVLYVVLPGVFLSVYGSAGVQATFETRDPLPRWTDRCPTPVLGLCLFLLYLAVALLFAAAVSGSQLQRVACLGLAAFLPVLAWAAFRLRPWAWWSILGVWLLGAVSTRTFFLKPFAAGPLYQQMGLLPDQIADLEKIGLAPFVQSPDVKLTVSLVFLGALVYLLWVRKSFASRSGGQDV
jgi:hypothetical protein